MTSAVLFALASLDLLVPALVLRSFPLAILAAIAGLVSIPCSIRLRNPWTALLILHLAVSIGAAVSIGGPWPALATAFSLAAWSAGISREGLEGFPPRQRGAVLRAHAASTTAIVVGAAGLAAGALAVSLPIPFGPLLLLACALPLLLAWLLRLVPLDRRPRPRHRR